MTMEFSVLVPFVPKRPEQVLPFAGLVRFGRAERLWQGQSLYLDAHQQFATAAGAGIRVPAGFGVSLMPLRHPWEAALQTRSVAAVTGRPVVAGFGPGAPSFQQALLGRPYASPLTASREYLTIVRGLLAGRRVDVSGEYFHCHASLPDLPGPPIELGLGVLRPGMAAVAGEIADVCINWLAPAEYVRDVIAPAAHRGADRAGRDRPRIVSMVPLALARKDRDAAEIALASSAAHLRLPHYIDMLRRSGIDIGGVDLLADARSAVAGGAFLSGSANELADQLAQFGKAGVGEVVLNLTGVCNLYGPEAALAEAGKILDAVA